MYFSFFFILGIFEQGCVTCVCVGEIFGEVGLQNTVRRNKIMIDERERDRYRAIALPSQRGVTAERSTLGPDIPGSILARVSWFFH